jgi:hypothetical protein
MAAISAEATEHYGGSYDPGLPKTSHGTADGSATTPPDDAGGTI